jgi:hypothetical protein
MKKKSRHYMNTPQKVGDDQFYRELPILMQGMIQWMNYQLKAYQQQPPGR